LPSADDPTEGIKGVKTIDTKMAFTQAGVIVFKVFPIFMVAFAPMIKGETIGAQTPLQIIRIAYASSGIDYFAERCTARVR
jgi:hypothetical protein